jgi:lipopolysaccharide/colanic/teichoic acid biosynthesis glycosyltransferase
VRADITSVAYADETAVPSAALETAIPRRALPALRGGTQRWQRAKRLVDPVAALAILVVLSPLMLLIALAIRIDSGGPVLFRQRRIGRGMQRFTCLKFRTMTHNAPQDVHRRYIAQLVNGEADTDGDGLKKLTVDPRVTRVGRFLRSTSLDELPQLLNVLVGEMALVGPRPSIDYELEHYGSDHFERFTARPGLTGLWQVSGRNSLGFREMLDLDVRYARTNGPWMDLQILLRTPITLVRKHAA